ncbi:helix-turn-helix domain-containing protein [Euzebya sp.]|uniref:helix-turn-helix domain-containing protein n=1 Tax=Euzebya sp. TaxID=1971409 RepID=UPI003517B288
MHDREDDLADLIMRRLHELGLSQSALAREAGISADTVRKVLRGEGQSFRRLTLSSLSQALGWPPDALERLFDGHDNPWADRPRRPWAAATTRDADPADPGTVDAHPDPADAHDVDAEAQPATGADHADDRDQVVDDDLVRRIARLERLVGDERPGDPGGDLDDLRRRVARLEDLALDRLART